VESLGTSRTSCKNAEEHAMKNKRQTAEHAAEFRENAIRRTQLKGQSIASVAEDLGIPAWKLNNWIKDSKRKLERSSDLDELLKAHNRIKELEEEVEILKKATAYFAKNLQ
jgi:transposase